MRSIRKNFARSPAATRLKCNVYIELPRFVFQTAIWWNRNRTPSQYFRLYQYNERKPDYRGSILKATRIILLIVFASPFSNADEPKVTFNRDVRSILAANCFACHGQDEDHREADLRLDTFDGATADLGEHQAIVPGKLDESELWQRVISDAPDAVMPPPDTKKTLSEKDKTTLRRWIEQGAEYEQHWSFIAPKKPDVPKVEGVANPIDAFVQARLAKESLRPAELADNATLIRRVTLDLTGLPPTLKEIDNFLENDAEDAYIELVEDLQGRVTYGEHMARFWLDLARYADTHGLHLDNKRSMWPYRDWVVRAINDNLPFDEFTRWQLAGDLLSAPTRDQLIASGFNRCNVSTGEGGSIKEEWIFRYAVDRTSTMSEVWMGLTAGCAVCHDHKFDPISAKEYYSMYSFFHSAADPAMDGNKIDTPPILRLSSPKEEKRLAELSVAISNSDKTLKKAIEDFKYVEHTSEVLANDPARSWKAWRKQDEATRNKQLSNQLKKQVSGREPDTWTEEETKKVFDHWLKTVNVDLQELTKPLKDKKGDLEKEKQELEKSIPLTFVMADLEKPRESFVMLRGAYDKPGEQVHRQVPSFLPPLDDKPKDRDYNRLDLANWLVSGEHPLTARVTVNRVWQQFFGTGLVETSEDFGTQGQLPSHPELLDWLSVQLVEDGWDMKKLVRRIVTSHAYRQSSKLSEALEKRDPQNRLLAHGPRLRLDAEVLRDQALFVSGLLVPTVGGEGVNPYQPPNIWEPVAFGGSNTRFYKQGSGDDLYRRSLYTFFKRTAPSPFMSSFDAPNREQSCSRRGRSNTPMQALQLMNDIQHIEAARNFAERMIKEGGNNARSRMQWAFRTVTSRYPTYEELKVILSALSDHRERFAGDATAAKELVSYGESKVDETIAVEDLAAYTLAANLLLNLDESVSKN